MNNEESEQCKKCEHYNKEKKECKKNNDTTNKECADYIINEKLVMF